MARAESYVKLGEQSSDIVNLFVHSEGDKFLMVVNGVEHSIDPAVMKAWFITNHPNKTIRLMSCSSLESAQEFSIKIGTKVQACEGEVKIFADGGIKSANSEWFELLPTNTLPDRTRKIAAPRAPVANVVEYVSLGNPLKRIQAFKNSYRATYSNVITKFEGLADDATRVKFLDDFEEKITSLQALQGDNALLDAWQLLTSRSTVIRREIASLQAVKTIRQNPKFAKFGLTDDIFKNINGGKIGNFDKSFADVINEIDELIKILPEGKVNNLDKFIGTSGFGNGASSTVRSAYTTSQYLRANSSKLINAVIEFEYSIAGTGANSITDIVVRINSEIIHVETKAGDYFFSYVTSDGSNFGAQSYNMLFDANRFENVKVVLNSEVKASLNDANVLATQKARVIAAWKKWDNGAILKSGAIRIKYNNLTNQNLQNAIDFENALRDNNQWFDLMFKNNGL